MSTEAIVGALVPLGIELAKLGVEAARGERRDPADVARQLIEYGLQLVPVEELRGYLDAAAIARAEALADVAEIAKFGTLKGGT